MGSTWEQGNGSDYQGYVPLGLCILFGRERVEMVFRHKEISAGGLSWSLVTRIGSFNTVFLNHFQLLF